MKVQEHFYVLLGLTGLTRSKCNIPSQLRKWPFTLPSPQNQSKSTKWGLYSSRRSMASPCL